MKIINTKSLEIPDVKVIEFARFMDDRGYFTEQFRKSDLMFRQGLESLKDVEIVQANQSYSKEGVIRGMHFQWNPYMGKLVRTLAGEMVDLILDIRKDSPTHGKMIAYDMPFSIEKNSEEWIWIPPGFAHGNFFTKPSMIEYLCSGEYNSNCEAGISPLAKDIDWSLCDKELKRKFERMAAETDLITDKDKFGLSLEDWDKDERSHNFIYKKLKEQGIC